MVSIILEKVAAYCADHHLRAVQRVWHRELHGDRHDTSSDLHEFRQHFVATVIRETMELWTKVMPYMTTSIRRVLPNPEVALYCLRIIQGGATKVLLTSFEPRTLRVDGFGRPYPLAV